MHVHVIKYTHSRILLGGSLRDLSSLSSKILPFSMTFRLFRSFHRDRRERREKEGFLDCAILKSTRHPGLNKRTICVEDYLICYVFLTNHKHPGRVEMAEEWKGYSREPRCQSTRTRQRWRRRENFVNWRELHFDKVSYRRRKLPSY